MTVRIGDMTFADWASLPFEGGWTDTFIFRVSSQACLPPFDYAPLLKRIVAPTRRKRKSASIWVQVVDPPGEWFAAELKRSLHGLHLPFAVTHGERLDFLDFSLRPWLGYSPSPRPPLVEEKSIPVSQEELLCLQALARMRKAPDVHEMASLAGLPVDTTQSLLAGLEQKKLAEFKTGTQIWRGKSKAAQMDLFPSWHLKGKGLSLALRSWGAPGGVSFKSRWEENLYQIGTKHRNRARHWPAWLKSAWPQAEIWAGWSEVGIPGLSVIPDGLAWGRIQGYETLFWLEVGDAHKSKVEIYSITKTRLKKAIELCSRTGVRLVYTQLSVHWVHEAARWGCAGLPEDVAVVMGNQRRFGELPVVEWGVVAMV
jgi:hypothetical protein